MLRHSNITSTMKYTQASNAELVNAVNGMTWADRAQREQPEAPALPDLASLTPRADAGDGCGAADGTRRETTGRHVR
jgi:hypothetical protein